MFAPVVLIIFATILVLLGPALLLRISWFEHSPRIGIFAWQVLSISLISTVLLAGLTLAIPVIPWTTHFAELIRMCAMAIGKEYSTPGGAVVSTIGAIATLAIFSRIAYCLITDFISATRNKREHLQTLAMIATPHHQYQALVVDHDSAAVYCLPGRHGQVVLTTGALAALNENQLTAVLAHEQAHLHGRHHLIIATAGAMQHAFPKIPAFREIHRALAQLVEMLADDNAARHSNGLTVATALVRLAEYGNIPLVALGAGGESTAVRIRRLASPIPPLGAGKTALSVLAFGSLLIMPVLFAMAPASAMAHMSPCPLGSTHMTR